jgi:hypothetical protein
MTELTNAFRRPSFPCNPIPFANALAEGVKANGTDWIKTDEARAILFILIGQAHGQLFNVDCLQEFNHLNRSLPK